MSTPRDRFEELGRLRDEGLISDAEHRSEVTDLIEESRVASSRGRRRSPFVYGGIGFVAGVLLLLVIGVALVAGGSSSSTSQEHPDTHLSLLGGSNGAVASIDGTQNHVTVTAVDDPAPPDPARPPKAGSHYVTIHVAVENAVGTPIAGGGGDFGSSFFLHTTDGAGRAPSVITSELTFEVPDGASINWLKFNPNLFVGSLYFDATPVAAPVAH